MKKLIKVLIVDDSPLFAEAISLILQSDSDLSVVGVASNGKQAVELTKRLHPNVITMDIHMPVMDGLEAIEHIMAMNPTPILVVTGDPRVQGDELNFEALRRGALEVMAKPNVWDASTEEKENLREQVKFLAGIAVVRHLRKLSSPRKLIQESNFLPDRGPAILSKSQKIRYLEHTPAASICSPERGELSMGGVRGRMVAMVASTGGPAALAHILEALPPDFSAGIAVVQHIANGFDASLAAWLNTVSALQVRLAEEGVSLEPGIVWIAPDRYHMVINSRRTISLESSPPMDGHRPSGSRLLTSVARAYGRHAIGVILTGMGQDGVTGLETIRDAGGITIAQDEASCVVFGMPKAALEKGAAKMVLPLDQMSQTLCRLVGMDS